MPQLTSNERLKIWTHWQSDKAEKAVTLYLTSSAMTTRITLKLTIELPNPIQSNPWMNRIHIQLRYAHVFSWWPQTVSWSKKSCADRGFCHRRYLWLSVVYVKLPRLRSWNGQESLAIANKPARRESMPKIAPIRRAYNVVADNTGLSSFV